MQKRSASRLKQRIQIRKSNSTKKTRAIGSSEKQDRMLKTGALQRPDIQDSSKTVTSRPKQSQGSNTEHRRYQEEARISRNESLTGPSNDHLTLMKDILMKKIKTEERFDKLILRIDNNKIGAL